MKLTIATNWAEAQRQLQAQLKTAQDAVKAGVKQATDDMKTRLNAEIAAAGLGKLSRTWHAKFYENNGFDAAGFVYNKAPVVVRAFSEGAVIVAKNGKYLAIPTEYAPKKGANGRRITPKEWPVSRFGPLRFVQRKNGACFLVADNLRPSYAKGSDILRGYKHASKTGVAKGQVDSVVMFVLVRQVTLKKRLSPDQIAALVASEIPGDILKHLEK